MGWFRCASDIAGWDGVLGGAGIEHAWAGFSGLKMGLVSLGGRCRICVFAGLAAVGWRWNNSIPDKRPMTTKRVIRLALSSEDVIVDKVRRRGVQCLGMSSSECECHSVTLYGTYCSLAAF